MRRPDIEQLRRLQQLHDHLDRCCTLFEQIVGELEPCREGQWRYVQSRVTLLGNRLAIVVNEAQAVAFSEENERREIRKEAVVA